MVTEDYVSFETAKLLKEKGFDESCTWLYDNQGRKQYASYYHSPWPNSELAEDEWSCCTLQMVMKWLREVHKLSIEPYYDKVLTWVVDIKHIGKHTDPREFETVREKWYKTYEEACETAIKYCLENLI